MKVLQDRSEINEALAIPKFFPPFFSALLPELGRPQYLKECVESIHRFADMPVEIIVHDDGSPEATQRRIFQEVRDKVSTIIFDTGYNTGLARAFNRCRSMASSDYLLGFNTDTYLTSSFLKRMKTALDLPYVAMVNVVPHIEDGPGVHVTPDGTKIALTEKISGFHCAGIKAQTWDLAGGWDEKVQTTASDVGFLGHILGLGLFPVLIEGTIVNEMWCRSEDGKINAFDKANPNYVMSSSYTRGDNNVPPIFGIPKSFHDNACELRRERIWHGVNDFILRDPEYPFWYNSRFHMRVMSAMFPEPGRIDWEAAKRFGHDRWREQVSRDFKLEL